MHSRLKQRQAIARWSVAVFSKAGACNSPERKGVGPGAPPKPLLLGGFFLSRPPTLWVPHPFAAVGEKGGNEHHHNA